MNNLNGNEALALTTQENISPKALQNTTFMITKKSCLTLALEAQGKLNKSPSVKALPRTTTQLESIEIWDFSPTQPESLSTSIRQDKKQKNIQKIKDITNVYKTFFSPNTSEDEDSFTDDDLQFQLDL